MSKTARHQAILDLVADGSFKSQDELARALNRRGFQVTQSTLSRDLGTLRVVRTPDGYASLRPIDEEEPLVPVRARTILSFTVGVEAVGNLVVIRTTPGSASVVAKALDTAEVHELAGTVAGDDTVLAVMRTPPDAKRFARDILEQINAPVA